MVSKINKKAMRMHRHVRVRGKISGTPERPRLNVFRSNANIYAQIIDDVNGVSVPRKRASRRSFSTAAVMCTMAVSLLWPMAPVKPDSSSKSEEER